MEKIDLELSDSAKKTAVEKALAGFHISDQDADKITKVFESELESGMREGLDGSSLQMENTFVPELADGTEEGKFLALDLGGTNFRVMMLELKAGKIVKEEVAYYSVEESKRMGPGEELFDFLAECIHDFVEKQGLLQECLPLGFTFSFPMTQTALNSGILVTWTKSFACPGVVGTDAVRHLNAAIARMGRADKKLKVEVVAILNDTTGTLVKGSFDDNRTCIGLILGTGCNGAYLEKSDRVLRWGKDGMRPEGGDAPSEVIVDPEFGAFGDNGCIDFIKTEVDKELDKESLLPGSFTFEKYFAGKYIGEIVRLALVRLHKERLFCGGQDLSRLESKNAFEASDMSAVEEDTVGNGSENCREIGKKFGLEVSGDDEAVLKHLCALLTHRGTMLVALVLASLLRRMAKPGVAGIAVTGSLYKLHPRFKALLEKYTEKYAEGNKFVTFLSDDGSGKGAGLVAAIADRVNKRKS